MPQELFVIGTRPNGGCEVLAGPDPIAANKKWSALRAAGSAPDGMTRAILLCSAEGRLGLLLNEPIRRAQAREAIVLETKSAVKESAKKLEQLEKERDAIAEGVDKTTKEFNKINAIPNPSENQQGERVGLRDLLARGRRALEPLEKRLAEARQSHEALKLRAASAVADLAALKAA